MNADDKTPSSKKLNLKSPLKTMADVSSRLHVFAMEQNKKYFLISYCIPFPEVHISLSVQFPILPFTPLLAIAPRST